MINLPMYEDYLYFHKATKTNTQEPPTYSTELNWIKWPKDKLIYYHKANGLKGIKRIKTVIG